MMWDLKKNIFEGTYIPRKPREDTHFSALIQMVNQSRADVKGLRPMHYWSPEPGKLYSI